MLEKDFQKNLVKKLEMQYPGAIVFKNETKQGFPDITVLWKNKWALLECKKSKNASHQPNQDYWIDVANSMSFASFIYPENEGDVLDALEQAFRPCGKTCVSQPE